MLKKWDASRRIKRDEIYKYFSVKRKEEMFCGIAANTFEKGEYFIPQRSLEALIGEFIKHLPYDKGETFELDCESILKAVETQHGIFVERAKKIYSFSHLTFQEYFVAKYCTDNAQYGSLKSLVNKHITDENWREVFLITAGILPKSDNFMLMILNKLRLITQGSELDIFLKKIAELGKNEEDYPPVFNRVVMMNNMIIWSLSTDLKKHREIVFNLIKNYEIHRYQYEETGIDSLLNIVRTMNIGFLLTINVNPKVRIIYELISSIVKELQSARELDIAIVSIDRALETRIGTMSEIMITINGIRDASSDLIKILENALEVYDSNSEKKFNESEFNLYDQEESDNVEDYIDGYNYSIEPASYEEGIDYDVHSLSHDADRVFMETFEADITKISEMLIKRMDEIIQIGDEYEALYGFKFQRKEDKLIEYLKSCKLTLDMLNADCYITKDVRKILLDNLFLDSESIERNLKNIEIDSIR